MVYHKRYMYDRSRHGPDYVDPNQNVRSDQESSSPVVTTSDPANKSKLDSDLNTTNASGDDPKSTEKRIEEKVPEASDDKESELVRSANKVDKEKVTDSPSVQKSPQLLTDLPLKVLFTETKDTDQTTKTTFDIFQTGDNSNKSLKKIDVPLHFLTPVTSPESLEKQEDSNHSSSVENDLPGIEAFLIFK